MPRLRILLILLLCVLFAFPAAADQLLLPQIPGLIDLSLDHYAPVLTGDNLADNEAFILARGGTLSDWQQEFKDKGILLKAYDDKNNRVLVITALSDADAQRYGDMDQQSASTRGEYRRGHLVEGAFLAAGYKADSVEWRSFPDRGRFLMIRYAFRPGGELQHRGFMRKSVKNGLTISFDMQVYGRALKGNDNAALNKVFDSFAFTGSVAQGVELKVFLNETAAPPRETNQQRFTLEGTTKAGTLLQAVVMSFETNKPEVFRAEADNKGNYSMDIDLGSQGIYLITLTASHEGMEPLEKAYSVTYAKDLLPIEFISELPKEITGKSYKISGKTEPGVTVQMILNDKNTTTRTNNNRSFSFNVPTPKEGIYKVRMSFSKKGFTTRVFDFEGVKGAAELATPDAAQATAEPSALTALSPSYTDLIAQAEAYDGQSLTYDGYLTGIEQVAGDYSISLALRKAVTGYADTLILISPTDPQIRLGSQVRVVGRLEGLNVAEGEALNLSYPRLQLDSIELLAEPSDAT